MCFTMGVEVTLTKMKNTIAIMLLTLSLFVAVPAHAYVDEAAEARMEAAETSWDRPFDVEQLRELDRSTLALMRNEIFARHGRSFQEPALAAYFMRRGYRPDSQFSSQRLSAIDWRNVHLIRQVEDEKGGPRLD